MSTPDTTRGARVSSWGGVWRVQPRTTFTSETKPFFLTSEFLAYVLLLLGLGIAAATDDSIDAPLFWILATAATAFYMLSRGMAKAGAKSRAYDPREDIDLGRREG